MITTLFLTRYLMPVLYSFYGHREPPARPAAWRTDLRAFGPQRARPDAGWASPASRQTNMSPRLLIIDDEPNVLYSLEQSLRSDDARGRRPRRTPARGSTRSARSRPTPCCSTSACRTCRAWTPSTEIRQLDPRLPVIIITAYATTETAIEAMKRGAFDYLLKPVDFHQLRDVVAKAFELSRLAARAGRLRRGRSRPTTTRSTASSASSPAMQEVYKAIGRVAPQDVTVLILGESGTGKELVARAIYQHSRRAEGRSWRSTAPPSPRRCSRASCSATRRARSPGPTAAASASSSRPTAARSSSTRSAT